MREQGLHMKRRKTRELIPFGRSRRVIRVERRGRRKMHIPTISAVLMILGLLCILYCLGIFFFMGYGTLFFLIWGLAGAGLIGLGFLGMHERFLSLIPVWIKIAFGTAVAAGMILFVLVEGMIISRFGADAPAGAEYCLILGAQMKEHGPSDVLRRRLDAGIAYLEKNPETKVIVSGGQGANEPVTEAQGMYTYLVAHGIAADRIIMEAESGNTCENLEFSGKYLNRYQDTVVIVTNNFHVFRAEKIAGQAGYEDVHGLAASSYPYMVPNNLLREFFGVIKDFFVGNL